MGYLTFISETGIPHSACLFELKEGGEIANVGGAFSHQKNFLAGLNL